MTEILTGTGAFWTFPAEARPRVVTLVLVQLGTSRASGMLLQRPPEGRDVTFGVV